MGGWDKKEFFFKSMKGIEKEKKKMRSSSYPPAQTRQNTQGVQSAARKPVGNHQPPAAAEPEKNRRKNLRI